MHYQTQDALSRCRQRDLTPIRCRWNQRGNGYILTAATGEKRHIYTGSAHTALANAEWPKYGRNAVLWINADSIKEVAQ
jgi:hypothetical protein